MALAPPQAASLSDNQAYPQVCLDAANDYKKFNEFRRNPAYCMILDLDAHFGETFLHVIEDKYPKLAEAVELFRMNDAVGGPVLSDYPRIGFLSPCTLRYIKILGDLLNLFGSLDGMDIGEIGVGYGGQCRVINAYCKPTTYALIDIQPALALTHRYLGHFITPAVLSFFTMNELPPMDYDLAISNYAFTELTGDLQDVYLQKVLLRSKRGYMIGNDLTPESYKTHKMEAIAEMIPGAHFLDEVPLTYPGNRVIVWGDR